MKSVKSNVLFVVFTVLIVAVMPRGLRGRQIAGDQLLGSKNLSVLNSLADLVEQTWLNCKLDPMDIKEAIKSLDFSFLESVTGDSFEVSWYTWEAFTPLSSDVKYTLLDCLRKKNFLLRVSGEDSPSNRYADYLASLLGWGTASRRHLSDQPNSEKRSTLAPAPVPVLASPGSRSPEVGSSSYSGGPPASVPSGAFLPQSDSPSAGGAATSLPGKHSSKHVVTAVVVAGGMSILAALLFFCCYRYLRNKCVSGEGQKDERPLLIISTSDFSGSSKNSVEHSGSIKKNKIGSMSLKADANLDGHVLISDDSGKTPASEVVSGILTSSAESSGTSINAVAPVPSPFPPLRPPPGRKVPNPPPVPPPPLHKPKPGPPPPPPPKGVPPRPPQASSSSLKVPRPPLGRSGGIEADTDAPKTKLKPLFWDKVSTSPEKSMVWNEIKSGSFQFNEEMIETLFGYRSDDKRISEGKKGSLSNDPSQYVQLLEPKKSQNLAIALKAMNVKIDEIRDALMEGSELPMDLLQTLLRMVPTSDEELKLRLYSDDPSLLGPGEQFLKAVIEIPFAFKRMDALLFMTSLQEDVSSIEESFEFLEVACKELRNSRLFLKLLEAVLKLGNRMNDGTFRGRAQAFKLDTLLKLSDVKGADGKTTLLHFVVQEIIRSEGVRAVRIARQIQSNSRLTSSGSASNDQTDDSEESENHYRNLGLKVVSGLSTELENVKKAAGLDIESLNITVSGLGHKLVSTKEFLSTDMRNIGEESGFHRSLESFVEHAEANVSLLSEEEKRMKLVVKNTTDYFHGNAGKDEGLRLFVIVRDFLTMLDKVCKEVRESQKRVLKMQINRDHSTPSLISEPQQRLFPAIRDRQVDSSSSDDEGS